MMAMSRERKLEWAAEYAVNGPLQFGTVSIRTAGVATEAKGFFGDDLGYGLLDITVTHCQMEVVIKDVTTSAWASYIRRELTRGSDMNVLLNESGDITDYARNLLASWPEEKLGVGVIPRRLKKGHTLAITAAAGGHAFESADFEDRVFLTGPAWEVWISLRQGE